MSKGSPPFGKVVQALHGRWEAIAFPADSSTCSCGCECRGCEALLHLPGRRSNHSRLLMGVMRKLQKRKEGSVGAACVRILCRVCVCVCSVAILSGGIALTAWISTPAPTGSSHHKNVGACQERWGLPPAPKKK